MNTNVPECDVMSPIDALLVLTEMIARVEPRLQGHGIRTAQYAVRLGHAVDLTSTELNDLCLASLLHDIGLLTVPQSLLRKEGLLTAEEYALVQSHPRAGAELLEPIPFLRIPALWIAHHHERWDGFGYPYGLRGAVIPLGARILAVADTFDALLSPHWSGQAHDAKSALCLLRLLAGSQLDPDLVDVFVRITKADIACPHSNAGDGLDI
jgi:HD-GYP domain-containing protein (c-di-GMP phosphodiesterase class II)